MILLYIVARSYDPQKAEEMLRKVQLTIVSDSLIVIKKLQYVRKGIIVVPHIIILLYLLKAGKQIR